MGEGSSEAEAEAVVRAAAPNVVLLDLKLSAGSAIEGITLCAKLSAAYPDIRLLVLTTVRDDDLVDHAVRAGAHGYVVKDVDTTELIRAIRAVAAGERAFDPRSTASMVRLTNSRSPKHGALTGRELEVLRLVAAGMSNSSISEQLSISATTAKFHVSNLLRKLGATRRADAVYTANKRGLI